MESVVWSPLKDACYAVFVLEVVQVGLVPKFAVVVVGSCASLLLELELVSCVRSLEPLRVLLGVKARQASREPEGRQRQPISGF
jgi:hypothetical protein